MKIVFVCFEQLREAIGILMEMELLTVAHLPEDRADVGAGGGDFGCGSFSLLV